MTTPTTVKVSITPEAAARAAELGIQAELERLIEHARQTVPGLQLLEVSLRLRYDPWEEPGILITAFRDIPHQPNDPTEKQWDTWVITTFPPRVWEHFTTFFHHGTSRAG